MGFKAAKRQVISCLRSGLISHEIRDHIDSKNLFATGVMSASQVEEIILRAGGNDYSSSPHHLMSQIEVHVIKSIIKKTLINQLLKQISIIPILLSI